MSAQGSLFPEPPPEIPMEILRLLSPHEIELARTMPEGGKAFAGMLAWLRKHPQVVPFFFAETQLIMEEMPFAKIQIEEVLCRVRRRYGIRILNEKGFFSRWLTSLLPALQSRVQKRRSKFGRIFARWDGDGK